MVVHALRAYKKGAEYSAPFLGTISELKGFYFVELEIYPPLEELPPVYHACGGWSSWPFAALGLLELGVEKLVGHGIDKGGFDRAVVECALDRKSVV